MGAQHLENDLPQGAPVSGEPVMPIDDASVAAPAKTALALARPISHTDQEILAQGGILPATASILPAGKKDNVVNSLKSADWKGSANLLVNAIRKRDGFKMNHDEVTAFLHGKDLQGWPESYRNWIGDELMTALQQDMPKSAFEDLTAVEGDSAAPAAMRDYSIQHIAQLVSSGTIGREGVEFIWGTLAKNDAQTLSTALISLHRLSEQVPAQVTAAQVRTAGERLREDPDERTRITAQSILKK